MSGMTTMGIGGVARFYTEPVDTEELFAAIAGARSEALPLLVIGRGSNIVVSDSGWPGLVVNLCNMSRKTLWDGATVTAGAGVLLDAVVWESVCRGLAGMEELSGIPGTVGGGVAMNAGAFSQCIADTLTHATYLDPCTGNVLVARKDNCELGYRTSIFRLSGAIVLSAQFDLHRDVSGRLEAARLEILEKRRAKQPLEYPNCGSVFKRPEGSFAGTLIEQCGLKGRQIGSVAISEKHANFIINLGGGTTGGTAADFRHLVVIIQKTVYEKFGIMLEPEVIFAGEFQEPLFRP
ncbi:MAG: UDP-N-acetylmuramate dehydrogenase [Chitinispirillaceae bacterium]|nr:UDP-N-acetylmuramate dehydrogenase [Chitinispirillaceae bacterium]